MDGFSIRWRHGIWRLAGVWALATASLALSSCGNRGDMPADIGIDRILASSSSGFFREACVASVYHLSEVKAQQISDTGLTFFATIAKPRNENPRNPYGPWLETPVPGQAPAYGVPGNALFAPGALGDCADEHNSAFHIREIGKALRSPGNYYALTSNREGMILVMPRARLAAYLYSG